MYSDAALQEQIATKCVVKEEFVNCVGQSSECLQHCSDSKERVVPLHESPEYHTARDTGQDTEQSKLDRLKHGVDRPAAVKTEKDLTDSAEEYQMPSVNIYDDLLDVCEHQRMKNELITGVVSDLNTEPAFVLYNEHDVYKLDHQEINVMSDKGNSCDVCRATFQLPVAPLEGQVSGHSAQKPHSSTNHNILSTSDSHLKDNQLVNKPYTCDVCKKSFRTKKILKKHLITHSDERPYSCGVCGKSYKRKPHLKMHLMMHNGEKPFHCDCCTKCFNTRQSLNKHKFTHIDQKPYRCDVCGNCFKTNCALKSHLLRHTEQRITCNVCGKGVTRQYWKRHMFAHTGQKVYNCRLCDKGCNTTQQLKQHLITHDPSKLYTCDTCKKRYKTKKSFEQHLLTHIQMKNKFYRHFIYSDSPQSEKIENLLILYKKYDIQISNFCEDMNSD
ncbi:zinc finger protein 431-like [Achroia grisella]|uniref:zinc finger protein 431-like n=1 Tax=Achroia grisella TaxID=688607 RepID=UPI0027D30CE4|nr:zinc finger protein 431-like [Achroia grisella]